MWYNIEHMPEDMWQNIEHTSEDMLQNIEHMPQDIQIYVRGYVVEYRNIYLKVSGHMSDNLEHMPENIEHMSQNMWQNI